MVETVDIESAKAALCAGELVVFPTDTVWGIGLAVVYAEGPEPLYRAKRRDAEKPIAWLVGGIDALDVYGVCVPDYARNLAAAFWPGALTLVVRAADAVPSAYRGHAGTIGLRMPDHGTALGLVHHAGPIATSSANLSGHESSVCIDDLDPILVASASCVLDDAGAPSGVASTVVDCTGPALRVLRQGSIVL